MESGDFYPTTVTPPASPTIISTLDIGTSIIKSLDFSVSANLVFFANRNPSSDDYNTVDVSTPATPVLLTSLNLNGEPYKLVYETSSDKVYVASGSDIEELQVITP